MGWRRASKRGKLLQIVRESPCVASLAIFHQPRHSTPRIRSAHVCMDRSTGERVTTPIGRISIQFEPFAGDVRAAAGGTGAGAPGSAAGGCGGSGRYKRCRGHAHEGQKSNEFCKMGISYHQSSITQGPPIPRYVVFDYCSMRQTSSYIMYARVPYPALPFCHDRHSRPSR